MHNTHSIFVILLAALMPGVPPARELRVADVFTDHALLQQGVNLPVWGTATAREKVTVQFAGQTKTTHAGEDGSWRVELSPLKAHSAGSRMIVASGEQINEFRNVLVGEVWYASGQSNMQMTLDACARKIPAIRAIVEARATDHIRVLRIDEADSPQPLTQRQKATPWQVDSPANRRRQSAVAYFFARALHQNLGVPIGIMDASWGGKPIEGFIPRPQFEKHESLRAILSLAEQNKLDELAAFEGGVVVRNTAGMPGRIFNARVAPIAPFPVRGFIWYQASRMRGAGKILATITSRCRHSPTAGVKRGGSPNCPCISCSYRHSRTRQPVGFVCVRNSAAVSPSNTLGWPSRSTCATPTFIQPTNSTSENASHFGRWRRITERPFRLAGHCLDRRQSAVIRCESSLSTPITV